ncbi:MAG: hypothetical protein QOI77_3862 [Blastocatellia bacterium]|nr:hypothetical protein [Blastocatellia bacterium]
MAQKGKRSLSPPQSTTTGIADAEIWRGKTMSLPGRKIFKFHRSTWLLILLALLLALPCVAVAAFTRGLDFDTFDPGIQEPRTEEQTKEYQAGKEAGANEARRREQRERDMAGAEPGSQVKAELAERARREQIELGAKQTMQATLVNLARIPMDQAIQIATSQQPGKVLSCTLVGERWESLGKLAKGARVLYHAIIISGDETNSVTTHVLINALDGSVVKTEKEERGKERTREPR